MVSNPSGFRIGKTHEDRDSLTPRYNYEWVLWEITVVFVSILNFDGNIGPPGFS